MQLISDDFRLYLTLSGQTKEVASSTNASLDISIAELNTSTKSSGRFNTSIGGQISGSLSCDVLVLETADYGTGDTYYFEIVQHVLTNRQPIYFEFKPEGSGQYYYTGQLTFTSLPFPTTKGELIVSSLQA